MQPHAERIAPDPGSSFRFLARRAVRFGPWLHHHALLELHAIDHGAGTAVVGDRVLRWRAPAAFLIGPGLVHAWISDPLAVPLPHRSHVLQAWPDLPARLAGTPEGDALAAVAARAGRGLLLGGDAAAAVCARLAGFAAASPAARLGLWLESVAAFTAAPPLAAPRTALSGGGSGRFDAVRAWLDRHATGRVTLAGAARVAGMHPQALARFFRRHAGMSVIAYVQRLRVARACELLRDGDQPVAACAAAAGFAGSAHFNRVFRRLHGCTPAAWRRLAAGAADPVIS